MKIAFLVSALSRQAPVFVVKDLIEELIKKPDCEIELFYLDDIIEIDFKVPIRKLTIKNIKVLEGFDIVHSHGIRPDFLTNFLSEKIIKITTQHNIIYDQYQVIYNPIIARFIEILWLFCLRDKDIIVAIGEAAKKYFCQKKTDKTVININNGRSPALHILSDEDALFLKNIKKQYKIIGACTRVVKLKGHAQIIKALKYLPSYCFVLIGQGDYLDKLIELAKIEKVSHKCFFMGHRDLTYGYLDFFDIYAMTSYSESVSIALLEAASAKKAILCSDIESNRYLFTDEEVAFFELDNIQSLIDNVISLDNPLYAKLSYQKYRKNYTKEIMSENYYQLYLQEIAKKN